MKCARCFFTDGPIDDETCRRCPRNVTRGEVVDVVLIGVFYVLICRLSWYFFTGDYVAHLWRGGIFPPVSLGDIFTHPIKLMEHPWHLLTVGWTFGLIMAVPALCGVFYGSRPAAILAVVGGYFTVVPFFFVPLALGWVLAGAGVSDRLRFPTSLVVGVIVPLGYFTALMLGPIFGPAGRSALTFWGIAAGVGAALTLVVTWAAKKRDWSAKFLPWAVAAQGAAIFVVFYASVGFSKVEYEFLRQEHGAEGPAFRVMVRVPPAGVTDEEMRAGSVHEFETRRAEALKEFSRFISWFPRAPETPQALYERAELTNLRPYFTGTRPEQVRGYSDLVTPEALADYRTIRADFPMTLVALEARRGAARYYLQHEAFDNGVRELRDLVDYCDVNVPLDFRPPTTQSVLQRWRSHRLSGAEETQLLYEVLQEARSEIRFIERNQDCDRIPLAYYYQTDMHDPASVARLTELLEWLPDCQLADNIRLALLENGRWTLDRMKALYEQFPKGDAAPRMLLLLGTGYLEKRDRTSAETYLRKLATDFPDSPEAARAQLLLKNAATGEND